MNNIVSNSSYCIELNEILSCTKLDFLQNKSIMIVGATGMIGSCLIDLIMKCNNENNLNCKVFAIGRSIDTANYRFENYLSSNLFKFYPFDINQEKEFISVSQIDFIIHLASNTHPQAYSTDPIGTILTNIIGTQNLLDYASKVCVKRFLFISSCEIYGESTNYSGHKFSENSLGYINCNTLRAGYPESKRCGEALCQAYIENKNLDIVVARLSRVYGPTMLKSDTKAMSQFIIKGVKGEDIVLKSQGTQCYSYTYVLDAVSAIMYILRNGEKGEAYNVSGDEENISLRDISKLIAEYVGRKVIFDYPDETEKKGYSTATKSILDNTKCKELGWKVCFPMRRGIIDTIDILKSIDF